MGLKESNQTNKKRISLQKQACLCKLSIYIYFCQIIFILIQAF